LGPKWGEGSEMYDNINPDERRIDSDFSGL